MSDRRRKGSLGWYWNSKLGLRTLIPVHTRNESVYAIKMGMGSQVINQVLHPITYLQLVNHQKKEKTWNIKFSEVDAKKVRRIDVEREINTSAQSDEQLKKLVLASPKLDVIGLTKGRGTLGPIARRNVKMQKRKAASSGAARCPGAMGLRIPGRVPYTKPFSGRTGACRRTLFGLENLGTEFVKNYTSFKYHIKEGTILKIKGSIVGPIGRVVCLRRTIRPL